MRNRSARPRGNPSGKSIKVRVCVKSVADFTSILVSYFTLNDASVSVYVGRMAEDFDAVQVESTTVEIKLFGKWGFDEVHVTDISLAVSK